MNNNQNEEAESRDLFDRRWIKMGIFVVIPAVVFILICGGIRVSQYGINHTIVVLGQRFLQVGAPAAFRVSLIADGEGFVLPDRLDGHLVQGERRKEIFRGSIKDVGYAPAINFIVPDLSVGVAVLELEVWFGDRKRIVRADVKIVSGSVAEVLSLPKDAKPPLAPLQLDEKGNLIQAYTEDRGAPTGFTSVLFFRALDSEGSPVKTTVKMNLLSSLTETKEEIKSTDRLGLMAIPIKPFDLDYPVEVIGSKVISDNAKNSPDSGVQSSVRNGYIFPNVVYGGIYAALHNPIPDENEPIRITARQLSRGGPLYVDVFHKGRWVQANSAWFAGDGSANLEIRPPVKGLVRLQISNSVLSIGKTVAVRHAFITDDRGDMNTGIRALLKMQGASEQRWAAAVSKMSIEGGVGFDRRLTAAFLLSRLYKGHQVVERIISSRKEDDKELGSYKASFQRGVMIIILLLGLSVAVLIGMMARQAQRRQARLTLMIMSENGEDESGDLTLKAHIIKSRIRMIFQAMVLLLIVGGAFASIALLIDVLKWGAQ